MAKRGICAAHGIEDCGQCAIRFMDMLDQTIRVNAALKKKTNTEIGRLIYENILDDMEIFSACADLLEEAADRLIQPECFHAPKFVGNLDPKKGNVYEMWQCPKCGKIWDNEPKEEELNGGKITTDDTH